MKQILVRTSILIAFGAVAFACGSSETKGEAPGTGTGGGSNGGGSAESGGSSNPSSGGATNGGATSSGGTTNGGSANNDCTKTTCTGKKAFGQPLDACCISADVCGVTSSQLGGQCLPLSALANIPQNLPDGGFPLPTSEKIVLDPTCPDVTGGGFGGPTGGVDAGGLKGCCDKTNVCGFAVEATQLSLTLCLTAADIKDLGSTFGGSVPAYDAGPQQSCTYKE